MKYMLLIYSAEAEWLNLTENEQQEVFAQYMYFGQKHAKNIILGEALQPTATATSVRVRERKMLSIDGPFAETKEALGGFYLIEAADLDEAVRIAADVPTAREGTIEVRPVLPTH